MLKRTGVDIIDLTIGSPDGLKEAASLLTAGSRIVIFGGAVDDVDLPMTMNQVHYNQISMAGSSGTTIAEYRKALEVVERGLVNIKELISHTFPLDEIMTAFDFAEKSTGLKVIIKP
jgi:L-iditol 2-dehydrogenase